MHSLVYRFSDLMTRKETRQYGGARYVHYAMQCLKLQKLEQKQESHMYIEIVFFYVLGI